MHNIKIQFDQMAHDFQHVTVIPSESDAGGS